MKRYKYLFIAILTLLLGLASREYRAYLPDYLNEYIGDAIWAAVIYWGFRFIIYHKPLYYAAIFAWIFSVLIEFSELYKAPWIKEIRATTIGGLILGFDFAWSDIVCYTVGIVAGFFVDRFLLKKPI